MKSNVYFFKFIAFLVALFSILSFVWLQLGAYDETHLRFLIQWSAKIAASFFAIAFSISSIHYLFGDSYSSKLLKYRSEIGISFAIAHLFHLLFLILLQSHFHPVFEKAATISLLGGGLAYLFLIVMMMTSFPFFKSMVTPKSWTALHTIGGYWIWFIFTRSYFKNVVNKNEEYFLFTLLVLAIMFRLLRILKKRFDKFPASN